MNIHNSHSGIYVYSLFHISLQKVSFCMRKGFGMYSLLQWNSITGNYVSRVLLLSMPTMFSMMGAGGVSCTEVPYKPRVVLHVSLPLSGRRRFQLCSLGQLRQSLLLFWAEF